jgi:anti-sigma regulatory factor (Ser/Thr protein kinase)
LIIPNEAAMVYPVQSSAKAYAELLGFESKACYHIELLLEEVLTNIIKYDFMPDKKKTSTLLLTKPF